MKRTAFVIPVGVWFLFTVMFCLACSRDKDPTPPGDGAPRAQGPTGEAPFIFEINPNMGIPGQKIDIFGMNFSEKIEDVKVEFHGKNGEQKTAKILKTDSYEIECLVPYDVPPGVTYMHIKKKTDQGWIDIEQPAVFLTPENDTQTVENRLSSPDLDKIPTVIGFLNNPGEKNNYRFVVKTDSFVSIRLESIQITGFDIKPRYDGYPDVMLRIVDKSAWVDDLAPDNLNASILDSPCRAGTYYIEVTTPESEEKGYTDEKQLMGYYRLSLEIHDAPVISFMSAGLGSGDTVLYLVVYNLDPESKSNRVDFIETKKRLGIFERDLIHPAEIIEIKAESTPSSWTIPLMKVRVPAQVNAGQDKGYRVWVSNDKGNSEVHPPSMVYFFYPGHGPEILENVGHNKVFRISRDDLKIAGHTDRLNDRSRFLIYAYQSQRVEFTLQAIKADLSLSNTPLEITVESVSSGEAVPFDDQSVSDAGLHTYLIKSMPEGGLFRVRVEPPPDRPDSLFWLTIRDQTPEPEPHEISIVGATKQDVAPGLISNQPLQVKVTRAGVPWVMVEVVFEAPCKSYVIPTDLEGVARWEFPPNPPSDGRSIITAHLIGSDKKVTYTLDAVSYTTSSYWDWDRDTYRDSLELVLGSDPRSWMDGPLRDSISPETEKQAHQLENEYEKYCSTCPMFDFSRGRH